MNITWTSVWISFCNVSSRNKVDRSHLFTCKDIIILNLQSITFFYSLNDFSQHNILSTSSLIEDNFNSVTNFRCFCKFNLRTSSKHITLTRNLKDVINKYKKNVLNINFGSLSCHDGGNNSINFNWEVSSCSVDKFFNIIHNLQFTNRPTSKFITCYFININLEFFKCLASISWNSNCATNSNS